ncbi:hypothetical protein JCM11641_007270, partial [Rhodosporidiobolus odoratus]
MPPKKTARKVSQPVTKPPPVPTPSAAKSTSPSPTSTQNKPQTPAATLTAKPIEIAQGELIVYAVTLSDDGSPQEGKQLLRLPPPVKPYVLRITIDPGTAASRQGVLRTNFPLNPTDEFERDKFGEVGLPQDFSKPFEVDLPVRFALFFYFSGQSVVSRCCEKSATELVTGPGLAGVWSWWAWLRPR